MAFHFLQKGCWNFDRDCTKSFDGFGCYGHLEKNVLFKNTNLFPFVNLKGSSLINSQARHLTVECMLRTVSSDFLSLCEYHRMYLDKW